jgi:hypothetical protein
MQIWIQTLNGEKQTASKGLNICSTVTICPLRYLTFAAVCCKTLLVEAAG